MRCKPRIVSADLPFAVSLNNGQHGSIHTGARFRNASSERKKRAEAHLTIFLDVTSEFYVAERTLQIGEKEAKCVCIAPDVRTSSFARADLAVYTLPAVKFTVFQSKNRRRLQNGHSGRNRVDHHGIKCGTMQGIAEERSFFQKRIVILQPIKSRSTGIRKARCIIVFPSNIMVVFVLATPPIIIIVRHIPGKHEARSFSLGQ